MTPSIIAKRIREGDELAYSECYMAYYPRVMAWLRKVMGDSPYTEDIAQDTFYKLWVHRSKIDPAQSLEAWLFTILRNTTITFYKRQLRQQIPADVFSDVAHDAVNDHIDHRSAVNKYELALQQVPAQSRECFRLHREEGLSYRQIAEKEGLAERMVEFHISRTLKYLRKALLNLLWSVACLLLMIW